MNGLLGGLLLQVPSGSVLQWLAAREEDKFFFMGSRHTLHPVLDAVVDCGDHMEYRNNCSARSLCLRQGGKLRHRGTCKRRGYWERVNVTVTSFWTWTERMPPVDLPGRQGSGSGYQLRRVRDLAVQLTPSSSDVLSVQVTTHRHLRGAGRSLQRSQAKQPLCGGQLLAGKVHIVARVVQLAPMERLRSTSRPSSTSAQLGEGGHLVALVAAVLVVLLTDAAVALGRHDHVLWGRDSTDLRHSHTQLLPPLLSSS